MADSSQSGCTSSSVSGNTSCRNQTFQPSQSTMSLHDVTEDHQTAGPSRIIPGLPTMNQPLNGNWTESDWGTNIPNGWTNSGFVTPRATATQYIGSATANDTSGQNGTTTPSSQPRITNIETILATIETIKKTAFTPIEVLQSPGAGGMTAMEGYNKCYLLIEGMIFAAETLKLPADIMQTLHHMKSTISRVMAKHVIPYSHATVFSSLYNGKFEVVDLAEMSESNGNDDASKGTSSEANVASPAFSSTGVYTNGDMHDMMHSDMNPYINDPVARDTSPDVTSGENFTVEDEYVVLRITKKR